MSPLLLLAACTMISDGEVDAKFAASDSGIIARGDSSTDTETGGIGTETGDDSGSSIDEDHDGYSVEQGDCDDSNAAVYPGASEACNDGVDNDCDGGAGACSPSSGSLATAIEYTGEADDESAGGAVSGVGDVNADGFDDFVVGAQINMDGGEYAGAVHLVLGGAAPASGSLASALQFTGAAAHDYAGDVVSAAGDVDADGYADFLVGATGNDEAGDCAGAAYLILGSPSPASSNLSGTVAFHGEAASDYAGFSVAAAGDVNGDGFDDVMVGAAYSSEGAAYAGAAYLMLGSPNPASSSLSAALEYSGKAAWENAGSAVAGVGDVDGDGAPDLLIGAPANADAGSQAGAAYFLSGNEALTSGSLVGAVEYQGEGAYNFAGYALGGAGDVDGDGHADMVIGAYGNSDGGSYAGAVYLILGSTRPVSGTLAAAVQFSGGPDSEHAGVSVSGAGDVDGDGHDDFAVGANSGKATANLPGVAYLVLGETVPAASGFSSALRFGGEVDYDQAGGCVSGAGDVNADGYADVLVGADSNDDGGRNAGAAYLLLGTGL